MRAVGSNSKSGAASTNVPNGDLGSLHNQATVLRLPDLSKWGPRSIEAASVGGRRPRRTRS